jgi:hypothetical protein
MAETPKNSKPSKRTESWWSKNWFYTVLITIALIGGLSAFGLPLILSQPFNAGDSISTLRQAILAATGGVLAILTLWENRRKNIQEKEKNDQDHTRQVHAERRTRYAKAVEQLADEKAPIRLGGVYTLVKLVDEWLADEKTLPNEEERREEGQVIISSLCAYIRSPFDLASRAEVLSQDQTPENYEGGDQQLIKDEARFREEKELRLTILDAIKTRLNSGTIAQEDGTEKPIKGPWSNFDYNFSNARFFYPVNFAKGYFGASSNFTQTTFAGDKGFTHSAFFRNSVFIKEANFSDATFHGASFSGATFENNTDFTKAKFFQSMVDFPELIPSEFNIKDIDFSKTKFKGVTNFFGSKFLGTTNFSEAKFIGFSANFTNTKFLKGASFHKANFMYAVFKAEFTEKINFSKSEFIEGASFFSSRFIKGGINFDGAIFKKYSPIFEVGPNIKKFKAKFSYKVDPENYDFEVGPESPYKIETEEQELNGVILRVPKGSILFDPDDPSEQKDDDDS